MNFLQAMKHGCEKIMTSRSIAGTKFLRSQSQSVPPALHNLNTTVQCLHDLVIRSSVYCDHAYHLFVPTGLNVAQPERRQTAQSARHHVQHTIIAAAILRAYAVQLHTDQHTLSTDQPRRRSQARRHGGRAGPGGLARRDLQHYPND